MRKSVISRVNYREGFLLWVSLSVISLCAGITGWTTYAVFVRGDASVYAENGIIENVQAILLAAAFLLFILPVLRKKVQKRLISVACSLLCYSFLVRELDVERLDVPLAVQMIGSGIGRNVSLVIGFAILLICACARFSYYKDAAMVFLKSHCGLLLLTAGLLLGLGDIFEKSQSIAHNAFYEETTELYGYVLMLLSALGTNTGGCPDKDKD